MLAWLVSEWGRADGLSLAHTPIPEPGPRQVLVRVHAAGLNFADGLMLAGRYQLKPALPFVLGAELAGVVVKAAPGSDFQPGDRVAAQVWTGAFAPYCAVDEDRLIRLPDNLDFAEGAALPVSYTTAHLALFHEGRLRAGQTILIHAAAGGAGGAATQLAKSAGARVLATASSDDKLAVARAHGADVLINYRQPDWSAAVRAAAPDGVDLVIDPVGGEVALESIRHLAWRGRLLMIGFASGAPAQLPSNRLLVKAASAVGVFWNFEKDQSLASAIQAELVRRAAAGEIRPRVGARYPLNAFPAALAELEAGRTTGKVVLEIQ